MRWLAGCLGGGREGEEGTALLLSGWLLRFLVEWKKVSSRLMWI